MISEEAGFILFSAGLLVTSFFGFYKYEKYVCESKATKMGVNHEFKIGQGCMIEYAPGKWIDIEKYRIVD